MCDRGMLEINPNLIKLDYCIAVSEELQKRIVDGISKLIGEEVFISSPKQGEYPSDRSSKNSITINTVAKKGWDSSVVYFCLEQLPGCCGVLVSYHTNVYPKYQNKGINSFLQEIKEQIAIDNGYTCLLATVTSDNLPQIHILTKYGWKPRDSFKNKRTGNVVITFTKHLED